MEMSGPELTEFVIVYGVWLVAAFIALESIGIPLPAEATLIAAAFFCARTDSFNIWTLIATGTLAAIAGDVAGFWIGRMFGHRVLTKYGTRVGITEQRMMIGQWLFARYGGRFVFAARFLPVLRNIAAALAGTNRMAPARFYFAGALAAAAWVSFYAGAAYLFGEAFKTLATSVAVSLAMIAGAIMLALPTLILRCEKRLLAKAEVMSPARQPAADEVRPIRRVA
jgi:membrane protein DedA with SNARE-associated domain